MGLTGFQGDVVNALNDQDARNQELLGQVVDAASAVSDNRSDVTLTDAMRTGIQERLGDSNQSNDAAAVRDANASGAIAYGGKIASLQGTGGVALLEFAKDAIQTAVSNISGMGTNQIQARKIVERKVGGQG